MQTQMEVEMAMETETEGGTLRSAEQTKANMKTKTKMPPTMKKQKMVETEMETR